MLNSRMPTKSSKEPDYFKAIALHEVIGGKPNLTPYKDSKGILTIGYGHKILPNEKFTKITPKQALDLFYKDLAPKIAHVKKDLGEDVFNSLSKEAKENIVGFDFWGYYRLSPKAIGHLKDGKYFAFAKEMKDNKDYRESLKDGSGIAPRFDKYVQPFVDMGNAESLGMTYNEAGEERFRVAAS